MTFMYMLGITVVLSIIVFAWTEIELHKPTDTE